MATCFSVACLVQWGVLNRAKGGDCVKLRFNEERAVQLFTILQDLWNKKSDVFEGVKLPQDRWPIPDDPKEAANYFAYAAITQRGGVVSEDPFKWVNHLRGIHPSLFHPHSVVRDWTREEIMKVIYRAVTDRNGWHPQPHQFHLFDLHPKQDNEERLQQIVDGDIDNEGLYKLDEFAGSWFNNSLTLVKRFDGDALNIFAGARNFEEAFVRIDYKNKSNIDLGLSTFSGMRRKIFSLFTIWLQEKGLVPAFPTPIPVDFHAMRLLFACRVAEPIEPEPFTITPDVHPEHFQGRPMLRVSEDVTDEIALWSQSFMQQHGFSHMAINPSLWVLSRELCPHEFQNQGSGRGRLGPRRSLRVTYPETLKAHPEKWPVPYADPSKICPVARLCELAIPNAPYYSFGILALLERLAYPHKTLPGFDRTVNLSRRKNIRN